MADIMNMPWGAGLFDTPAGWGKIILFVVFGLSLVFCLFLTPLFRLLALRWNLIDKPDDRRKMHRQPIPVAGGIPILVSSCLALTAVLLMPNFLREKLLEDTHWLIGVLLAVIVICAVGVLDDFGYLRGRHKLAGQFLAAGIVIASGLIVRNIRIFGWNIELGNLSVPFTAFFLVGAINSLNLLDGMDGLLSCVGLIICPAMAAMALMGGYWSAAAVAVALAGGLAGFLFFNYPPATIFLGDCGSMLIGLVVGVLAIQSSLKGAATVALVAPLAALTIPILDTTAAILRRKLTGRSIYTTDRGHLHHCLLNRGLSTRAVLMLIGVFCLMTVTGALVSLALNSEVVAVMTALVVAGIMIGLRLFGHAEFMLAKKRLLATASSFLKVRPNGKPQATEAHLQGSAEWKHLWDSFVALANQINLKTVCLDVNAPAIHERYHARWDSPEKEATDAENPSLWFSEIPLVVGAHVVGRMEVVGQRDQQPVWKKVEILMQLGEDVEAAVAAMVEAARLQKSAETHSATNGQSARPRSADGTALVLPTNGSDVKSASTNGTGVRGKASATKSSESGIMRREVLDPGV
jgi:UDP-GlcNAc:undecaprenyl-phosphate GlcNAc-1-phosphate transferase